MRCVFLSALCLGGGGCTVLPMSTRPPQPAHVPPLVGSIEAATYLGWRDGGNGCHTKWENMWLLRGVITEAQVPGPRATIHNTLYPIPQTRNVHPVLVQCWTNVEDDGPTLYQHWVNVSCLMGYPAEKTRCYNIGLTYLTLAIRQIKVLRAPSHPQNKTHCHNVGLTWYKHQWRWYYVKPTFYVPQHIAITWDWQHKALHPPPVPQQNTLLQRRCGVIQASATLVLRQTNVLRASTHCYNVGLTT